MYIINSIIGQLSTLCHDENIVMIMYSYRLVYVETDAFACVFFPQMNSLLVEKIEGFALVAG